MKWINAKNEPEIGQYCIVHMEKQGFSATNKAVCQFTKYGFDLACVTHWMPVPSDPLKSNLTADTLKQIAEINEQEKKADEAFKKWISADPNYYSVGKNGRECLVDFVAALNMEIADLKSEIARLKANK